MRKLSKFMGGAAKEESKPATSPMPHAHEQGNREWHGLSTQDRLKQVNSGRARAIRIVLDGWRLIFQALTQRKVADSALASARNRLKEDRSRLEGLSVVRCSQMTPLICRRMLPIRTFADIMSEAEKAKKQWTVAGQVLAE